MKIAIIVAIALAGVFAGVTFLALEASSVAIIETQKEDGTTRTTHVWLVQERSELWLEAGSPTNGWFVDIQRTGELSLATSGNSFRYRTRIDKSPAARKRVRSSVREKYGWRDRWVGMFVDHEEATAVRLIPAAPQPIPQGKRNRQAKPRSRKKPMPQNES